MDELLTNLDRECKKTEEQFEQLERTLQQLKESDRLRREQESNQAAQAYQQQRVAGQADATGDRPIYNGIRPGSAEFEALGRWDKVACLREFEQWQKRLG